MSTNWRSSAIVQWSAFVDWSRLTVVSTALSRTLLRKESLQDWWRNHKLSWGQGFDNGFLKVNLRVKRLRGQSNQNRVWLHIASLWSKEAQEIDKKVLIWFSWVGCNLFQSGLVHTARVHVLKSREWPLTGLRCSWQQLNCYIHQYGGKHFYEGPLTLHLQQFGLTWRRWRPFRWTQTFGCSNSQPHDPRRSILKTHIATLLSALKFQRTRTQSKCLSKTTRLRHLKPESSLRGIRLCKDSTASSSYYMLLIYLQTKEVS